MRRIAKAAGVVGALYLGLCALMFLVQDRLLFFPTELPEAEHVRLLGAEGVQALEVDVPGARLRGYVAAGRGSGARPTVIYFGGNAQPVWPQVEAKRWLRDRGMNVVVVAYRGYDRSSGELSGAALQSDALAVFDAVAARPEVDPARIYAWGLSLGTGAATQLACRRPLAGAILMAPYTSLAGVAAERYPWLPVRALFRHEVDSLACASEARAPALIFHGTRDRLIAPEHGRTLARSWGAEARFVPLDGAGHNDLSRHPNVRPAVERFVGLAPGP